MDYPPNASIPVYNEHTVYVKALRIPKGINVQFKNDVYSKREPVKTTGTVQNNKNLMFMEDEQKPKDENKQSLPTMTNTQKEAKKENANEDFVFEVIKKMLLLIHHQAQIQRIKLIMIYLIYLI